MITAAPTNTCMTSSRWPNRIRKPGRARFWGSSVVPVGRFTTVSACLIAASSKASCGTWSRWPNRRARISWRGDFPGGRFTTFSACMITASSTVSCGTWSRGPTRKRKPRRAGFSWRGDHPGLLEISIMNDSCGNWWNRTMTGLGLAGFILTANWSGKSWGGTQWMSLPFGLTFRLEGGSRVTRKRLASIPIEPYHAASWSCFLYRITIMNAYNNFCK